MSGSASVCVAEVSSRLIGNEVTAGVPKSPYGMLPQQGARSSFADG